MTDTTSAALPCSTTPNAATSVPSTSSARNCAKPEAFTKPSSRQDTTTASGC